MRIEIIGNASGGASSISGLHTDFDLLLTETDSVIDALKKMKSFSCNMSGGIGILQNAVGNVDSRLQAEEIKKNAISSAKGKCESFLQLVSTIDSQVAETVSVNKENFYSLNKWARPSVIESTVESWYASAKEWIRNSVKTVADHFTHSFEVYNETDFSKLTFDELKAYHDKMLKLIESGNMTEDDKIRLKAFMDYLKKNIDISSNICDPLTGLPSPGILQQVDMYNSLYEQLHPDEEKAMKNIFIDAPEEYKSDVALIKYTAYTSEGTCHDVFFKYADKVQIADYDTVNDNGEARNYYSPYDMKIHINIESMRKRGNHYGTFFHESGHSIDAFMAIEATGTDINHFREKLIKASSDDEVSNLYESIGFDDDREFWYSSSVLSNGKFHDTVYNDVEKVVGNLVNDYSSNEKHLSDEQKALITDVLMGRKLDSEIKDSNTDFAYRKVLEDITGAWKGKYSREFQTGKETGILETPNSAGMLSEVMNGMTNNSLMVNEYNYSKTWGVDHTNVGHSINWHDPDPNAGYVSQNYYYNTDGSYTGVAETEYMAEYMRINMTRSKSELEYVSGYLPESWKMMSDTLKSCT